MTLERGKQYSGAAKKKDLKAKDECDGAQEKRKKSAQDGEERKEHKAVERQGNEDPQKGEWGTLPRRAGGGRQNSTNENGCH